MIDSGTVGLPGTFPGGGASGAGCPSERDIAAGFCAASGRSPEDVSRSLDSLTISSRASSSAVTY